MKKILFITAILFNSCTIIAQESLIAYYPFNGNADDESGNGYNGSVTGVTLAPDRFGIPNSAYYFNGSGYITVNADDAVLNVAKTGFTFSFWVKPEKGQTVKNAPIISYGYGNSGGYDVAYWEEYGMYRTTFYNYSWSGINVAKDELNYYDWYMYTFTYDGTTLREYVNGVYINETKGSYFSATPANSYALRFGSDSKSAKYFFKGYIDDLRICNRTLSDLEIANLSGYSGAIRVAKCKAYSLSDFELGRLDPIKFSNSWAVWGASQDQKSYIKVVENPVKSDCNTSQFAGVSVTFPSNTSWTEPVDCKKKEYVLTSADGLLNDHHHIMKWKILFPDSTILQIDTIVSNWMYFNQIHGGCNLYDGGTCETGGSIAFSGGIFNDNVKAGSIINSQYAFRYRAMPDSAKVLYNIEIGKWMSFTYEIFWTHSDSGYWRLWKDGKLLGSAVNVKTLPDCCDATDNFLHFKTGLYNKWTDKEIDSLPLYFDDIELYIGDDITVESVAPECYSNPILPAKKRVLQNQNTEQQTLYPNPVKDRFYIKGLSVPDNITVYSSDGRKVKYGENTRTIDFSNVSKGMYITVIKIKGSLITKHFVKE